MCIVIFDNRKTTERLHKKVFARSREKNPHGMGIMWPEDDVLHTWHTMDNLKGIWKRYSDAKAKQLPVALHFRKATVGKATTTRDNLHPFIIRENFAFMHNGTARDVVPFLPDGVSDTSFINTELFQNSPKGFINKPIYRLALEGFIDGGRMLFMDGTGAFTIINETRWGAAWKDGVWFSKGEYLNYYLTGEKPKWTSGYYSADRYSGDYSLDDQVDWWNLSLDERNDRRAKKHSVLAKTKKEKETGKAIVSTERDISTAPSVAVTGPEPSRIANLVFDYGYLGRVGHYDDRIKKIGPATIGGHQLWAIGEYGHEIPAALSGHDNCITGEIYEIEKNYRSVLDGIDNIYGCDRTQSDISVYRRKWMEATLIYKGDKVKMWVWVYQYAMSLNDVTTACIVPFGDWTRWDGTADTVDHKEQLI